MGFTWQKGRDNCLAKKLYRKQRQLATNHPDLLIKENQNCKDQKNKDPLLKHCKEKIEKEHDLYQRFVAVPPLKTEKRFNRYQ